MEKRIAWNKDLPAPWAKNLPQRFKKGMTPWNKNLKGYMAGEKNSRWKGGEIEIKCQYCEKTFKDFPSNHRKYCSRECRVKASKGRISPKRGIPCPQFRGENHWKWKGGIGRHNLDRKRVETTEWRRKTFKRDGIRCQMCGSWDHKQAHHIRKWEDYPELRYEVSNGITLCRKCHKLTFGIEEQCVKYFEELLQEGGEFRENPNVKDEGNLEPSQDSNVLEGATHRARVLIGQ